MRICSDNSRVYLSSVELEDVDQIAENANDYEIAMNTPGMPYPYTVEDARTFVEFARHMHLQNNEFHMAIRLSGNDQFIGLCGLAEMDAKNRKALLGYWLGKKHWGSGYAKEALFLIMSFGFTKLNLNKIYARVLTTNERSIKLLEGLDFNKESTNIEDVFHMGNFLDDFTYSMLRKNYKNKIVISIID